MVLNIQQCLYPEKYHRAIASFQICCRSYFCRRMARQAEFIDLFDRQKRRQLLCPSNCSTFKIQYKWVEELKLGDHIVVYTDLVFHHGIYMGHCFERMENFVMHVVADNNPAIQECTLSNFIDMGGSRDVLYGIVHHQILLQDGMDAKAKAKAEDDFRKATVDYARYYKTDLAESEFRIYDVVNNNCECFVWYVFTAGAFNFSEEVLKIIKLVHDELRYNRPIKLPETYVIN